MAVRSFTASALLVIALSSLSAQEPRRLAEAESIPLELASALISAGPLGGEPQILVGSMPEWASTRIVVPPGGRIIGSAFLGMTVVAVVSVSGAPDTVVANLKADFLQRGWKNPPITPSYGGGFRPSPTPQPTPTPGLPSRIILCGDQQMLMVSGVRRRLGGSEITYRLYATSGNNQCNPPKLPAQAYHSPFPTLYNPPTATEGYVGNVCESNNSGSTGTGTILRTSMTPEALLEHYGRQIVDSGWTAAAGQTSRTWTKRDSTGAPVEMTLSIYPTGKDGTCQRLDLQVRTVAKP